jgi:hypothetical protein
MSPNSMSLTCGTWGLGACKFLFNQNNDDIVIDRSVRKAQITVLRIYNLSLHILGYLSLYGYEMFSIYSGATRATIGSFFYLLTYFKGKPHQTLNNDPAYSGRLFYETRLFAISQIFRGVLEAATPWGIFGVMALDFVGTILNWKSFTIETPIRSNYNPRNNPHENPTYWLLFKILYLV